MPFNPVSSIVGNGVSGQVVASYTTGSSSWNIVTNNLPGQVSVGTFPNSINPHSIQSQNFNFTWPYRGGKNLPNSGTRVTASVGTIGISAVGIVIFNPKTSITIIGRNSTVWSLNSVEADIFGRDTYGGAPNAAGVYAYSTNDFLEENAWGNFPAFAGGSYAHPDGHSKLLGWAADGYPIYGTFGYINPLSTSSGTTRMKSGYVKILQDNRPPSKVIITSSTSTNSNQFFVYSISGIGLGMVLTGDAITTSTKIISITGTRITVNRQLSLPKGTTLTAAFPLGHFVEDFVYAPPSDGSSLDEFNGRFCKTPEFPNGTYAYFMTEDEDNYPAYPYFVGPKFYGSLVADSNNSYLSNLIPSEGTISPSFNSTVTNYSVSVGNTVNSINFIPVSSTASSVIVFNTTTVISGSQTPNVNLVVGLNTQTFTVTSQYKTTTTYSVVVNRLRSSVKRLSSLTVNPGTLVPAFASTVTSYTALYSNSVTNILVTAVKENDYASIKINNVTTSTGMPVNVPLNFGSNNISVVVTAQDESTQTYTISATRLSNISLLSNLETSVGSLSPSFTSNNYFYSTNVSNQTTSIRIKSTAIDNLSQISINGVTVPNAQFSDPIPLGVGITPIALIVTSSDETDTQFYRISVNRAFSSTSTLATLSISTGTLSPTFQSTVTNYSVSVGTVIEKIRVSATPTTEYSQLTINGDSVLAGEQSPDIGLEYGNNQITVLVTAEDKTTTKTYTINVTRALSTESKLARLRLLDNTILHPTFTSTTYTYTATVDYSVLSTKLVPTSIDQNSTIKVNNVSVLSNFASQSIPLSVGPNTISTVVTAQSNTSTSTYQITLTRKDNYDASISLLEINTGELYPPFDPGLYSYTVEQPYAVTQLDLTIFATDPNITSIQITNGQTTITTSSGKTSTIGLLGSIQNNTWNGTTTISINVLAADGESSQTYNISATRKPDPTSTLNSLRTFFTVLEQDQELFFSPVFEPTVTDYYINVPNIISSIKVVATATNVLSKTNISNVETGTSIVSIFVGNNIIPILVSNSDNTSFTGYNIFVNRAASGLSTNALLSALSISTGTLTPSFDPQTFVYQVAAPYELASVKVKASKQKQNSSIKINDTAIESGVFSSPISLTPGITTATIAVTAEDGVSRSVYSIEFIKQGSTDSSLKELYVSNGVFDKPFRSSDYSYRVNVPYNVSNVSIKGIANNEQASVYFQNAPCPKDGWSPPTSLTTGSNNRSIVVSSGDLLHETIYSINFVRAVAPQLDAVAPTIKKLTPEWKTPAGIISTATEGVSYSRPLLAVNSTVTYKIISGTLPTGLSLNSVSGLISGTPAIVYQKTRSEFVVRATNINGVKDRDFIIEVNGATAPIINTPGPNPAIGPSGETYIVNKQIVDFKFNAVVDTLPEGRKVVFFIEEGDGHLPPGLTLTEDGRLIGQVTDTVRIPYQINTNGNYDVEAYDLAPYEHESQQIFGLTERFIDKTYSFYLSASNGVAVSKAYYTIIVRDPGSLLVESPSKFPIAPQWLSPRDLGKVRSNSYQNIDLEIYDCDPGNGTIRFDTFTANNGNESVLPPGLKIDTSTGVLHGYLRYTPVYSTTYTFNVLVEKSNVFTATKNTRLKTFTLTVLGSVISSITFDTLGNLGKLYQGEQSELFVRATSTNEDVQISYSLVSGALPPGLSLASDGAILGKVNYTALTVSTDYSFTVKAVDSNFTGAAQATFTITILPYSGKRFTSIVMQPLLNDWSKDYFNSFITDNTVFEPTYLYRPFDPAFGVRKRIEFVLEYGIEQRLLEEYVPALQNYFSRKRLEFGDIKTAFALNDQGSKLYEVVYIELIDTLVTSDGVGIGESITENNITSYPNSIDNMRGALEAIAGYNINLLPKFMRTIQDTSGIPLGRILCMPLCYCLPGKSKLIIDRIKNSEMDFKMINFDVDRIIVQDSLNNSSAKYLLFPNREV